MRVLVYENCHLGHHYQYLQYMLPALIETGAEVVVSISAEGRQSEEFRDRLLPFLNRVEFDCQALNADPAVPLRERRKVYQSYADAVARTRAEYSLVPTGDAVAMAEGLSRITSLGRRRRATPGEVCLHFGYGRIGGGLKCRLRDAVKVATIALSRWDVVHVVNALFYEYLQEMPEFIRRRVSLLPHPVAPNPRLPRAESRWRLSLPLEGRYIGIVGSLDPRKAVAELLAAFSAADPGPDAHVLLAGKLHPAFRKLIASEYGDLVRKGRLHVLDRYLSQDEIASAYTALDVVCTPYPGFGNLSAALLDAVAAGRPVLTHSFGWTKAMVERFRLGWSCNVLDPSAFAATIRMALEHSGENRETELTRKLLEFHSPSNFAASLTRNVRQSMDLPPTANIVLWDRVADGCSWGLIT